jgi:hypothetical protein
LGSLFDIQIATKKLFARIKVPRIFPQWIRLKPETQVNEADAHQGPARFCVVT